MRISDWSSDVCSSDVHPFLELGDIGRRAGRLIPLVVPVFTPDIDALRGLVGMVLAVQGGAISLVVRDLVDVLRDVGVLRIAVHPHARGLTPASGPHRRAALAAGGIRAKTPQA